MKTKRRVILALSAALFTIVSQAARVLAEDSAARQIDSASAKVVNHGGIQFLSMVASDPASDRAQYIVDSIMLL